MEHLQIEHTYDTQWGKKNLYRQIVLEMTIFIGFKLFF